MDYASVSSSGFMLAATGAGLGWLGASIEQLWLLGVAAAILAIGVIVVRTRFRRGKSPEEL